MVKLLELIRKFFNFRNSVIPLVILIATGWFYWFQYRPANIRSRCENLSAEHYREKANFYDNDPNLTHGQVGDGLLDGDTIKYLLERKNMYYEDCLHRHGVNR